MEHSLLYINACQRKNVMGLGNLKPLKITFLAPVFQNFKKLDGPSTVLVGEEIVAINATLALVVVVAGSTGIEELFVIVGLTSDRCPPVILSLFADF